MATKTRKKRPKQGHLEGLEPPSVPAIDAAAEEYYETMMERVKLSKEEDEAKDNLIDKMKENGLDRYETPDGLVIVACTRCPWWCAGAWSTTSRLGWRPTCKRRRRYCWKVSRG